MTSSPTLSPAVQTNFFSTITYPINYNQQGVNTQFGPLPPFEFGINGKGAYDYTWIYVFGCIFSFTLACANGANDVANSFATSVGSKALKMWQAIIIASFCEFAGAALLGSRVTDTIRSKIATPKAFVDHDDLLMFGMMCAVISVTIIVFAATYMEAAVSITHSIVGAVMGFALCSTAGSAAVDWNSFGLIFASWFASPALAGAISFIFFGTIRHFVLRHANAFDRAMIAFPLIVCITFWVNAVFIIFKGGIASGSGLAQGTSLSTGVGFGIATGVGVGGGLIVGLIAIPWLRKNIGGLSDDAANALAIQKGNIIQAKPQQAALEDGKVVDEKGSDNDSNDSNQKVYSRLERLTHQKQIDDAARANDTVITMHENAEVFPIRVELAFGFLQIFTACFASFAHGSNDVANSVGPLSAIVAIYDEGPGSTAASVAGKSKLPVPIWVLFVGCSGLVVGLATYGHIIVAAMGMKYVRITPTRGFCAELSFSFVVVIGSFLGIPLSTTQCIVGAILGIGLAEGRRDGVNWWIFVRTLVGWVVALTGAGLLTAMLFSFGTYSPSLIYPLSKNNCLAFYGGGPVNKTAFPFFFSMPLNTTLGDSSNYTITVQDDTLIGMFGHPSTGEVFRIQ